MKLIEIFDTTFKPRNIKQSFDRDAAESKRNDLQWGDSGNGYSSIVKKLANDPFQVRKTSNVPRENLEETDGYYAYIKAIADGKLAQSNPYFPRVSQVKTYTDKNGLQQFKADLETLIEPTELSVEELMFAGKKMYNDFEQQVERYGNKFEDSKEKIIYTLVQLIEDSLYKRSYIKDPLLIQVVDLIDSLLRKYKRLELDMNMGNIMFRRGSNGVQSVITDPLSQIN